MFFTSSFLFLVSSLRFDFFKSSALWALASTRWTSARASSRDFNTPFTSYRRADWYGLLCCSLIKTYRGWTYSIQIILKTSTKVLKKSAHYYRKRKSNCEKSLPFFPSVKYLVFFLLQLLNLSCELLDFALVLCHAGLHLGDVVLHHF